MSNGLILNPKPTTDGTEETFAVKPVGKRMRCPKCKLGYMNLDPNGQMLTTFPPTFPHICDKCGYKTSYKKQYPCIDFEMDLSDTKEEPKEDTNDDSSEVH